MKGTHADNVPSPSCLALVQYYCSLLTCTMVSPVAFALPQGEWYSNKLALVPNTICDGELSNKSSILVSFAALMSIIQVVFNVIRMCKWVLEFIADLLVVKQQVEQAVDPGCITVVVDPGSDAEPGRGIASDVIIACYCLDFSNDSLKIHLDSKCFQFKGAKPKRRRLCKNCLRTQLKTKKA